MQNQKESKSKKKGKVQQVWELSQKGSTVKEIAEKTGLKEQIVRSYIWRKKNPDAYAALLQRYLAKRKTKLPNQETKQQEPTEKA
jgi:hypothetical protein